MPKRMVEVWKKEGHLEYDVNELIIIGKRVRNDRIIHRTVPKEYIGKKYLIIFPKR